MAGQHNIDDSRWDGKTTIDTDALRSCNPDERLSVEAWDATVENALPLSPGHSLNVDHRQ